MDSDKTLIAYYEYIAYPCHTEEPYPLIGDLNYDDSINIVDALLIAQYYVALPVSIHRDAADTYCSGSVDIIDALLTA